MRMLRWVVLGLLVAGLVALAAWKLGWVRADDLTEMVSSTSPALAFESFTLSNGMEVVLIPNDRVPAVSHMLWLRLGAADDPPGKSGLAHYHEHLMFKGTPTVPDGEYGKRITALGGQFNAFTGADFISYYVTIAREHLETVMQLESDRFQHLNPAESDYAKERAVVIEERQSRVENSPHGRFVEQMQALQFTHHPYRIPIIGWQHEIEQLTPKDAKRFYRDHYHAGNMVLVVAGDISKEALQPLAERYYGSLPARAPIDRLALQEPPAQVAKRLVMRDAYVSQPRFERRYLAPSYGQGEAQDVLALSLFAEWLGGGKTSLLYRTMIEEQQLAVAASAHYSGLARGPATLTIRATPAAGVSVEALEAALDDVLAQALTTPIAADDLARIKTLFKASEIYARDGLEPLAHYVGYLRMLKLPLSFLSDWAARVDAIEAEAIQASAQRTLVEEGSVTGWLLPEEAPAKEAL